MQDQEYCKRLIFATEYTPEGSIKNTRILIGIIEGEDKDFYYFRTAHSKYQINRKSIVSISDTNIIFMGENDEEN